jgi:septum formation protein
MSPAEGRRLLLASGSRYRAGLLGRLGLDFDAAPPEVDESALPGEAPADLALRLAQLKARTVHERNPNAWVIGSDQVADCGGRILGKPCSFDDARRQLQVASGRVVDFHTALCLLGPEGLSQTHCDLTRVHFRPLPAPTIERYLEREPALDCAGSFKAEGLGITLFDAVESRDPSALVGLPLIALAAMLRQAGFELP